MGAEDEGSGGGGGEQGPVPYDRFQRVVGERNTAQGRIADLEREVQTLSQKAATADTLARQLEETRGTLTAKEQAWGRERSLLEFGLTDPDGREIAEFKYSKLPEAERPPIGDWLESMKGEKWMAPFLGDAGAGGNAGGGDDAGAGDEGAAGGDDAGAGDQGGNGKPKLPRSNQHADPNAPATKPMSAEQIAAMRKRAQETGDMSELREHREAIRAAARRSS